MGWRWYAYRALTGQWLHTDLQVEGDSVQLDLSGPGGLALTLPLDVARTTASDGYPLIDRWRTILVAEEGNEILHAGIVDRAVPDDQGRLNIECVGFMGHPARCVYEGDKFDSWEPDVFDVVRALIAWNQNQDDCDLGLVVDPHLAGVGAGDTKPPAKPKKNPARADWILEHGNAEPYRLAWWDSKFVGEEVDQLATETPFDYLETHTWVDRDALTMSHRLQLGTPLLRRRRTDIAFVEGSNMAVWPTYADPDVDRDGNRVLVLGAGEGKAMRRARLAQPDGRLARTVVVAEKDIATQSRLDGIATSHLADCQTSEQVETVEISDQPGWAPVATLRPGDEVQVRTSFSTEWRLVVGVTLGQNTPAVVDLR